MPTQKFIGYNMKRNRVTFSSSRGQRKGTRGAAKKKNNNRDKISDLCLNESPIRYRFRAGEKSIGKV